MASETRHRWWAAIAIAAAMLAGCVTLDRNAPRTSSAALTEAEANATSLGAKWTATAPENPEFSAFRLLPNNLEAFAARIAIIDRAERTLDLQYYIFQSDNTGLFIIDRLIAAADRGVRVRLLIDDIYAHGIERDLAAFDAHPNIELRMFNPWKQRAGGVVRAIEFLFTSRLNHRMHNKLLIADGVVAILGGRNIADEYFDLGAELEFKDLDVACVGPVAAESGALFDAFWNGPDAIPVTGLRPMPDFAALLEDGRARLIEHREHMQRSAYAEAVRSTEFVQQLTTRSLEWVFAKGRIVGDAPDKTTRSGDSAWTKSLAADVQDEFFSAKIELLISSPYFVPGNSATGRLCDLAATGTKVRILTNSLSATDVPIVHAGYKRYRKRLIEGGAELFEVRRRRPGTEIEDDDRAFGSANASLHAKSFVVDREQVYIGSLNLDPRSVVLNTEIGVMIDSPVLAEAVARAISGVMGPKWSYAVIASEKGDLTWIGQDADGNETRMTTEPDTSWWKRFKTSLTGLLPIEDQL